MSIHQSREDLLTRLSDSGLEQAEALEAIKTFYLDATRPLLSHEAHTEFEAFLQTITMDMLRIAEPIEAPR